VVDVVPAVNRNLDLGLIINNHTSIRLLKRREEENTNMCTILYTTQICAQFYMQHYFEFKLGYKYEDDVST
jgi:hypothetical protein